MKGRFFTATSPNIPRQPDLFQIQSPISKIPPPSVQTRDPRVSNPIAKPARTHSYRCPIPRVSNPIEKPHSALTIVDYKHCGTGKTQ